MKSIANLYKVAFPEFSARDDFGSLEHEFGGDTFWRLVVIEQIELKQNDFLIHILNFKLKIKVKQGETISIQGLLCLVLVVFFSQKLTML